MRVAAAKQPNILSQMIIDAHEIREKQSSHRAHVINNVAIKGQTNADDSVEQYLLVNSWTDWIEIIRKVDKLCYI